MILDPSGTVADNIFLFELFRHLSLTTKAHLNTASEKPIRLIKQTYLNKDEAEREKVSLKFKNKIYFFG